MSLSQAGLRTANHPLRVMMYGNNLNMGDFIVSAFRRRGVAATLLQVGQPVGQESRAWWTDRVEEGTMVFEVENEPIHWGRPQKLTTHRAIGQLYEQAKDASVIMMMENGPALFSELVNVPKVFLSQGADLQILPFKLFVDHHPTIIFSKLCRQPGKLFSWLRDFAHDAGLQFRQRRGLRQCAAIICLPHQQVLLKRLGLLNKPVYYCNFPMDPTLLQEWDRDFEEQLRRRYRDHDLIFFHPTRHFYLRTNNDAYLKDNDKLLRAFARFMSTTSKSCRLILIEKGRPADLAHSRELVETLHLRDYVDWLPDMPNKKLRAIFMLDRVVVCDQFSPRLAVLGNIGRETTYYGRPLITAFGDWNRLLYGNDWPPHVFPAESEDAILQAMQRVAAAPAEWWKQLQIVARAWFDRHLHIDKIICQYLDVLQRVAKP
ncbi:MAG: glycosyltransferase [Verrucomicrobiae bacterium]|nr:glycosyltransferase [Verrucomicrobiae bacterium]MDW8344120.1 glycosyltransferase [Verrucomicrobiae bacterium]